MSVITDIERIADNVLGGEVSEMPRGEMMRRRYNKSHSGRRYYWAGAEGRKTVTMASTELVIAYLSDEAPPVTFQSKIERVLWSAPPQPETPTVFEK
jgi:hypothetical protein